jgi:hypothetical protein
LSQTNQASVHILQEPAILRGSTMTALKRGSSKAGTCTELGSKKKRYILRAAPTRATRKPGVGNSRTRSLGGAQHSQSTASQGAGSQRLWERTRFRSKGCWRNTAESSRSRAEEREGPRLVSYTTKGRRHQRAVSTRTHVAAVAVVQPRVSSSVCSNVAKRRTVEHE